jgi:prepilin-type processing-associated H-X9-DG protein
MNGYRSGLRGRDGVVVLGCVLLALLTLGAVGRRRAKEFVCQSNLRQWHGIFQGYIEENEGKFFTGVNGFGYWWPVQLPHEYQDWKRNRTWFCPVATTLPFAEGRVQAPIPSPYAAWGVYSAATPMIYEGKIYTMNPNGVAGSFGLNGYTLDVSGSYQGGVPASEGWRNLKDVSQADCVPLFLDALRFDVWPRLTDAPAPYEFTAWNVGGDNHMARCCINRHDGAVNCLFVDGSVRKVGLKELWTLKWHRSFDTAGPWTKAGGVLPYDWPEWMRPFKEY